MTVFVKAADSSLFWLQANRVKCCWLRHKTLQALVEKSHPDTSLAILKQRVNAILRKTIWIARLVPITDQAAVFAIKLHQTRTLSGEPEIPLSVLQHGSHAAIRCARNVVRLKRIICERLFVVIETRESVAPRVENPENPESVFVE